jgi:ferredoxin
MNTPKISQYSINSSPPTRKIISNLIRTSLWGFFETLTLNIVHFIDRHIWTNFHTLFMRLIHNKFGGIVTPFDISLETNPLNRNWDHRIPYISHHTHNGQEFLEKGQLTILPTQEIFNILIRSNMNTSVAICYCRDHMKKHGHECELHAPLRTCITLRLPQSISSIRNSVPRLSESDQKALYKLLLNCEKIGLVHQVVFYERFNTYVICNCCPDCCEILTPFFRTIKEIKYHQKKLDRYTQLEQKRKKQPLTSEENVQCIKLHKLKKYHEKGANMNPVPLVARSAFVAVQDSAGECINCGKCAEHCYFGARVMKSGKLSYNSDLCYGCGLCVGRCVQSVIQLKKRPKLKEMSPLGIGIKHEHSHFS